MLHAVILAGGKAERMGGQDKGLVMLKGRRLIDHVVERLWRQCHQIHIVGPSHYGLGLPLIGDDEGFSGPAAGLFGAQRLFQHWPGQVPLGFLAVPIDGPNLPSDLAQCLAGEPHRSAVAHDDQGLHPTFGFWALASLQKARALVPASPSLRQVAQATNARHEIWPGSHLFWNINHLSDLESQPGPA